MLAGDSTYSKTQASKIAHEPPAIAKPQVEPDVITAILPSTLGDSCVYVHCHFDNPWTNTLIRIWKSTFLLDATSGAHSSLLHAENISIAPQWTIIPDGQHFTFLLIFSGLPKSCVQFDLKEEIPQPGGFHVRGIRRNETDVYHITLD